MAKAKNAVIAGDLKGSGIISTAEGITAKSKGICQVDIQFKDGKKSLVEINYKLYKDLIRVC